MPPWQHLTVAEEKERYSHHHNAADNPGYRRYMTDISAEIGRIPVKEPSILDFGSGYDWVLTRVLREQGLHCEPYDPLYEIGMENLDRSFDIVILCETIEHFRNLKNELGLVRRVCKPGGYVLIHTRFYDKKEKVPDWWYAVDETHINFFNDYACAYMAKLMGRTLYYSNGKNIVILGREIGNEA